MHACMHMVPDGCIAAMPDCSLAWDLMLQETCAAYVHTQYKYIDIRLGPATCSTSIYDVIMNKGT